MTKRQILRTLFCVFCLVMLGAKGFGQVDGSQNKSDTLYIYEEEVVYDTLYQYDTVPQSLLTKEETLAAFRQNPEIGRLYRSNGHFFLTGSESTFKLDQNDLRTLFSPSVYAEWQRARRNRNISIPLYVFSAGFATVAGLGIYQYGASTLLSNKYSPTPGGHDYGLDIWQCATGGIFLFVAGAILTTACIIPASILTVWWTTHTRNIVNNFNAPSNALRLSFGPTQNGVGLALSF